MLTDIKARLFRYCDLSLYALTQLKTLMKISKSFSSFDPANFSSPSLRIAVATNIENQPIGFCPVENILMVSGYAISPSVTKEEALRLGNEIDNEVAYLAQQQGISKVLICVPEDAAGLLDGEYKTLRVYERSVPQKINMHLLGCSTQSQPTHYIH